MRAVTGFILFQLLMIWAGTGVLGAFGLLVPGVEAIGRAAGPALLTGTAVVVPLLIVLLVVGVPLTGWTTVLVAVGCALAGHVVARRRRAQESTNRPVRSWAVVVAAAVAGAYAAYGAYALARLPTVGDDARIWSLKGLTLGLWGQLRGEIFHNAAVYNAHLVYPLFQPVLEAALGRAMGAPQLRLMHAELWLLVGSAIWTAGYLLWWRERRPRREQLGLVALALLALTPSMIANITSGFADVTGSVMLGCGALALALWIERDERGYLGLAAVMLAAAANTKDEDLVGGVLVLVVAGAVLAAGRDRGRLKAWLITGAGVGALVLPWRIWTAAHHLSDNVTPPLPRGLSPVYLLDRVANVRMSASAMLADVLSGWGWFAAVFLALCALCLATGVARRVAGFYLASVAVLVTSLLWLYTATEIPLSYLIPSSLGRTIDVFMMLTPFACAHLLTRLSAAAPFAFRAGARGATA